MGDTIGPMVHVRGVIQHILPDDQVDPKHQCLILSHLDVVRIAGSNPDDVADTVFCAIRYGDDVGKARIWGFEEGQAIEVQGEYLSDGFPSLANREALPVIHCVHKPFGFVKYSDRKYH